VIANITKGNGFHGCVAYVLGKDEAEMLTTNMGGETPAQLAREFRLFSNANERVQKPVLHLSLNPAPSDRLLSDWELCMITQDLLDGLELSRNQFIAVKHNDAEFDGQPRPHIHIVVNRVDYEGKCHDDYLDFMRTQTVLRRIEKDYDLTIQPSSWEVEDKKVQPKYLKLVENTGEKNVVDKIKDGIQRAAADEPEMPTFVARLLKENIEVGFHFTRTGKIKGISYCMEGQPFKGGELGNLYSHVGIQNKLKVNYKQDYQNEIVSLIENYKLGINIDDGATSSNNSTDNNDFTNESGSDNSQAVATQNSYVSVVPSIKEIGYNRKSSIREEELIQNYKSNINTDEPTSENNATFVTPPQNNNYISVVPSIEEIFGTSIHKETKNIATPPDATIETQPTIAPELQATSPTMEQSSKQSIVNDETVQYAIAIAGYMADQNTFELQGETLHATLSDNAEELTVKRRDSNEIILSGNYSLDGKWQITTAIGLTPKERERILKLKQRIGQYDKQKNDGVAKQEDQGMEQ
jgi:hypothetical protein